MSLDTLLEAAKFLESSSKGTSRDDSAIARVSNSATVQAERRRAFSESEPIERRRRPGGAGTRETHNKLEKNRRAHLKECFDVLKKEVPTLEDKKTSNLNILRSALKYIQSLKKRERDYEHERDLLTISNSSFRQRLLVLRREIVVKQENAKSALKEPEVNSASSLAAPAIKVRSVETQVSPVSVATQTTFTSADEVTNWSGGDPVNIESVQVEAVGVAPAGNMDSRSDEKIVEEKVCVDDEDEDVDVEGVATEDCSVRVDEAPLNGGAVDEQRMKNQEGSSSGVQRESNAEDVSTVEAISSNKSSALKRRAACSDERNKLEAKKANIQGCARVSS